MRIETMTQDARALIATMRVPQWVHFLVLPLAAFRVGEVTFAALALGVAGAFTALAYAYGINAIADRHSDFRVEKNPLRGQREISDFVRWMIGGMAVATLLIALAAAPISRIALIVSLVASTVYSVGPRAKSMPFLGALANALIFVPLLYVGVGPTPLFETLRATLLIAIVFTIMLLQNQLVHELADASEDARALDRTTATMLGERRARSGCVLLGVVGSVAVLVLEAFSFDTVIAALAMLVCGGLAKLTLPPSLLRVVHRLVSMALGALIFFCQVVLR